MTLSYSCKASDDPNAQAVFVGSVPGDPVMKSLLNIPAATMVDFIRWELRLPPDISTNQSFSLAIQYGESQPNTLGFKNNGFNKTFSGKVVIDPGKSADHPFVHLKSDQLPFGISMIKLNEQLFQLLSPGGQLMIGNGGWSNTLNRQGSGQATTILKWRSAISPLLDTSAVLVFEGRMPAQPFLKEYEFNTDHSFFKLKMRITFYRNALTGEPLKYHMRSNLNNRAHEIEGAWKMVKGIPGNSDAVIYQLSFSDTQHPVNLLVGDDNVLFVLDKNMKPYVGNADFSFTLNRRL